MKGAKEIEVVAGLIFREGRLLVCQRREDVSFPLKWEFPGGKVEKGETHEEALRREFQEELGIEIRRVTSIFCHCHRYGEEFTANLNFYRVYDFEGELRNLNFRQLRWVAVRDLLLIDFLAGDMPLVERLISLPEGELPG